MTPAKTLLRVAVYGIKWSIQPTIVVWTIQMLMAKLLANPKVSPSELLVILFAIFFACGMLLGFRREILARREGKKADE